MLVPATLMAAPVFAQAPPSPSYLERYLDADIAYFSYFQVQTPAENDRNPRNQVYRIDDYLFIDSFPISIELLNNPVNFKCWEAIVLAFAAEGVVPSTQVIPLTP